MYAFLFFVLHMEDVAGDFQTAARAMTAALFNVAKITNLVKDRALKVFALY